MPPAARTGVGATASTTSGTSTMVETSPVWPPASVPWATMTSTPAALCRSAWVRLPASAATDTPASCALVMSEGGGGPRALATSAMSWAKATSRRGSYPFDATLARTFLGDPRRRSAGSSGTP